MKTKFTILTAILLAALMLLLLSLFGCKANTHHLELLYSADDVVEIKIIELRNGWVETNEDYTLLKEIDIQYADEICSDIQSIEYKRLGPSPATPTGRVIMIIFESGEYQIISQSGPQKYKYSEDDEDIRLHHSYYYCRSEEQFNQMIDKWLGTVEERGEGESEYEIGKNTEG